MCLEIYNCNVRILEDYSMCAICPKCGEGRTILEKELKLVLAKYFTKVKDSKEIYTCDHSKLNDIINVLESTQDSPHWTTIKDYIYIEDTED